MLFIFNFHVFTKPNVSPACIGAFIFTAWRRNELGEAWSWTNDILGSPAPAREDAEVTTLETDVEVSSIESPNGSISEARKRRSVLAPL